MGTLPNRWDAILTHITIGKMEERTTLIEILIEELITLYEKARSHDAFMASIKKEGEMRE